MQWNGLGLHAYVAAADASLAEKTAGNKLGGVYADSKTQTLRAHDGGGVHADDLSVGSDQRAAGISWVEGGVGLNDVVDEAAGVGTQRASQGADHTGGDGVLKPIRIADRDGELADAKFLRVA